MGRRTRPSHSSRSSPVHGRTGFSTVTTLSASCSLALASSEADQKRLHSRSTRDSLLPQGRDVVPCGDARIVVLTDRGEPACWAHGEQGAGRAARGGEGRKCRQTTSAARTGTLRRCGARARRASPCFVVAQRRRCCGAVACVAKVADLRYRLRENGFASGGAEGIATNVATVRG